MIYQMPCPGKRSLFVASSDASPDAARLELAQWAQGHGYRFAAAPRTFTVYGTEQRPRQWVLMERLNPSSDTVR